MRKGCWRHRPTHFALPGLRMETAFHAARELWPLMAALRLARRLQDSIRAADQITATVRQVCMSADLVAGPPPVFTSAAEDLVTFIRQTYKASILKNSGKGANLRPPGCRTCILDGQESAPLLPRAPRIQHVSLIAKMKQDAGRLAAVDGMPALAALGRRHRKVPRRICGGRCVRKARRITLETAPHKSQRLSNRPLWNPISP